MPIIKKKRNVILFATHMDNAYVRQQIKKLKAEVRNADFYVLYQADVCKVQTIDDIQSYPFTIDSLNALNYNPIAETIVPGSCHFSVLQFFRDHAEYDYYWNIEYDVCFNGNWGQLFAAYEGIEDDFIASHIQHYDENPGWDHWDMMELNNMVIDRCDYIKSFNPIYRISNRALQFLDAFLLQHHSGHNELLIPTILHKEGYSMSDLGGNGSFSNLERNFYTPCAPNDNWYTGSSMRYRPLYGIEDMTRSNMLYHPIKGGRDFAMLENANLLHMKNIFQDINGRRTTPLGAE